MTFFSDGHYQLKIKTNAEALISDIGTNHKNTDDSPLANQYNQLRALSPKQLSEQFNTFSSAFIQNLNIQFDQKKASARYKNIQVEEKENLKIARSSIITLSGLIPSDSVHFQWAWPSHYGANVLKVVTEDGSYNSSSWLKKGETSKLIPVGKMSPPQSTGDIFIEYLELGFTHIVPKGLDHILFILGLFLLSLKWRSLLLQITAFTLAHTITLGMTIYGFIALSPAIVEPLIAISIVYVAVENIISPHLKPWRVALVFCFGLLHGMGFAGVLNELGLPDSERLTALISFNIGVEMGQVSIIIAAYILITHWFKNDLAYRRFIVIPVSLAIAATGAFWTIERIF